jgi:Clp amino terminal domain, pathogenicity island component
MQFPKTATALVLLGAVGLASAAYGIGSATGGGSATAEPDNTPAVKREFHLGPPPGFGDLADKLGVDEDELADAMRDFGEQEMGEHRDDFANALATALGISADKVTDALDDVVEVHRVRIDERLADALGVDASAVRDALDKVKDERPSSPSEFAEALAGELGVDTAKVEEALEALRPPRPPEHHRGAPLRKLAAALDVTRAELRKALREVRAGAKSGWEQHEEKLAAYLADRFGLDAGDVEEALADIPRPTFRMGPRGPGGPEFHGPGPGGPDGPGFGPPPGFGPGG